jgi:ribosome recycling factor
MPYSFAPFQLSLDKALTHLQSDVATLRTGKATSQLLDPVVVEAYGTRMKLHEVATVSVSDATLITVTPWDKSLLGAVEKAIISSGLNLGAVVDGNSVRVPVPALTEERRKEMVKILQQKIEGGRVMLRNVRTDAKKDIEKLKGQPDVSEDDIAGYVQKLDELLKAALEKLDALSAAKQKELLTI